MNAFDKEMMQRALSLAMVGRITAPPNPWVGCVIVKDNEIIGEGYHVRAGQPHAEIVALQKASERSAGSTLYVTLEPCSHFGKTPPCADALIKAKVARVVIGIEDPDSKVSGKGIERLQKAGITVDLGVEAEEIRKKMEPYLFHRRIGLPFCIAKAGISIDGRIAAKNGSSQWITSAQAREDAHLLRAESQAILIGSNTAINDNPSLTVRNISPQPASPPLRIILDSKGRVTPKPPLTETSLAPTLIATTEKSSSKFRQDWKNTGAEVQIFPEAEEGIHLPSVIKELGQRGILQILVEGGGTLLGSMLNAGLLQRFYLYIGPCILGNEGRPLFNGLSIASIQEAIPLNFIESKRLGSTERLEYQFQNTKRN